MDKLNKKRKTKNRFLKNKKERKSLVRTLTVSMKAYEKDERALDYLAL